MNCILCKEQCQVAFMKHLTDAKSLLQISVLVKEDMADPLSVAQDRKSPTGHFHHCSHQILPSPRNGKVYLTL